MKVWVEMDVDELQEFLSWQRVQAIADDLAKAKAGAAYYGRTDINIIVWPPYLLGILRAAGVETVEQAKVMTDKDWLKVPNCGRMTVKEIRETIAAHEKSA